MTTEKKEEDYKNVNAVKDISRFLLTKGGLLNKRLVLQYVSIFRGKYSMGPSSRPQKRKLVFSYLGIVATT